MKTDNPWKDNKPYCNCPEGLIWQTDGMLCVSEKPDKFPSFSKEVPAWPIVLSIFFIIVLIGIAVCCYIKKKKSEDEDDEGEYERNNEVMTD